MALRLEIRVSQNKLYRVVLLGIQILPKRAPRIHLQFVPSGFGHYRLILAILDSFQKLVFFWFKLDIFYLALCAIPAAVPHARTIFITAASWRVSFTENSLWGSNSSRTRSTQRCSESNLSFNESLIANLPLVTRKLRLQLLDLGLQRIVLVHLAAQEPSG